MGRPEGRTERVKLGLPVGMGMLKLGRPTDGKPEGRPEGRPDGRPLGTGRLKLGAPDGRPLGTGRLKLGRAVGRPLGKLGRLKLGKPGNPEDSGGSSSN